MRTFLYNLYLVVWAFIHLLYVVKCDYKHINKSRIWSTGKYGWSMLWHSPISRLSIENIQYVAVCKAQGMSYYQGHNPWR